MQTLTAEMKSALLLQEEKERVKHLIHPMRRLKRRTPERRTLLLPEEFTGRDLKRAKKLMKGKPK